MQLSEVKRIATYNQQNFEDKTIYLQSVEGNKVITKNEEFKISDLAKNQLLDKFHIRPIVNGLERWFIDEKSDDQKKLDEALGIKTNYSSRDEIIKYIIEMAIRQLGSKTFTILDGKTNEIKGVVGERYIRVASLEVLNSALEVYGEDIDPRFSYINDKQMSVSFRSKVEKKSKIVGEKVGFGYNVGNSETGWASLSLQQFWLIVRCTNGAVGTENWASEKIYHTSSEIQSRFRAAMNKMLEDYSILDRIDKWAVRKPFMDDLISAENVDRFTQILEDKGIRSQTHQEGIIKAFKEQQESKTLNGYWIGNAVNYYASHEVTDAYEAQQLLIPAYQIMMM